MPLLSLWDSNPDAVSQLTIEQIVATAGTGKLRDSSECSEELRTYLSQVPRERLASYAEHCLTTSFQASGMVLQDLINEIGRRLDYDVINGRYQGTSNAVGFDGVWRSPEGNDLVVEVKTTDAYRISLDTIAGYRKKLSTSGDLGENSSILIVVGREDTGELEAQTRGSRHAWDIRLISVEALLKLLQVKENSDDAETGAKIRSLFAPVEYTRLDRMVDVVFTAATDVEVVPDVEASSSWSDPKPKATAQIDREGGFKPTFEFTDSALLQAKRLSIISSLAHRENTHLLQKSRSQYWNADRDVRAVCTISKRYEGKAYPYWYAYHPPWDEFLADAERSYFVLGCMDRDEAYAIPRDAIRSILADMHQTVREGGAYWHIHLIEDGDSLAIHRPKTGNALCLRPFAFEITPPRVRLVEFA